jgi:hypothetical protein
MEKEALEAATSAVASKSTYGGAATSVLGWLLSSEATVVIGIVVAVVGLAVNWYYKAKADRRQQAEHEARMARLKRGKSSDTDLGELGGEG